MQIINDYPKTSFGMLKVTEKADKLIYDRVGIKKLDQVVEDILDLGKEQVNNPVDVLIDVSESSNILFSFFSLKGKYIKCDFEGLFNNLLKRNPLKFIKKQCEYADAIRKSLDL